MLPGCATRRILWARAAGRCAVCRNPLTMESVQGWPETAAEGAAGKPGAVLRLDQAVAARYDNLILLCEDHRPTAGQSSGGRSIARLRRIKANHEEWVRGSTLAEHPADSGVRYDPRYQGVTLLPRVRSGGALARLLEGVHSLQYDREEPATAEEQDLLEGFLRYLRGVADLWGAYDREERQRVAEHLQGQLTALEASGLLLFAAGYTAEARVAGVPGDWSILRLWILREGADGAVEKG